MSNYTVHYLGHSAWGVTTENYLIIFDYGEAIRQPSGLNQAAGLDEGIINLEELRNKRVFLLFSHNHHDHYDRTLHKQSSNYANVTAVLGGFGKSGGNSLSMQPREETEIDGVEIYTASSTDSGVCFLIKADNLVIYHGGDNIDWGDGDPANKIYKDEIDYIASLTDNTDIAFIPVCTFSGLQPEEMLESAVYAINKLMPCKTFPMHANSREYLYQKFTEYARVKGCEGDILCAEKIGSSDFS